MDIVNKLISLLESSIGEFWTGMLVAVIAVLAIIILIPMLWKKYKHLFIIQNRVKDEIKAMKDEIQNNLNDKIANIEGGIDNIKENIENYKGIVDARLDLIEKQLPNSIVDAIKSHDDKISNELRTIHEKHFHERPDKSRQIHDTLAQYRNKIGTDLMFLGSFYNSSTDIQGFPYYKFKITATDYDMSNMALGELELERKYKEEDIMTYNALPSTLIRNGHVHYTIDEGGSSSLAKISGVVYRRMLKQNAKQLTLYLLRNEHDRLFGFIGGVDFEYKDIDFNAFSQCATAIEKIYNK
ncbi:MAG: hypothetical protein IKU29_08215 [Parabacteroides sp.]|nr:hypothetical protein [Parabacteroides sp.]